MAAHDIWTKRTQCHRSQPVASKWEVEGPPNNVAVRSSSMQHAAQWYANPFQKWLGLTRNRKTTQTKRNIHLMKHGVYDPSQEFTGNHHKHTQSQTRLTHTSKIKEHVGCMTPHCPGSTYTRKHKRLLLDTFPATHSHLCVCAIPQSRCISSHGVHFATHGLVLHHSCRSKQH